MDEPSQLTPELQADFCAVIAAGGGRRIAARPSMQLQTICHDPVIVRGLHRPCAALTAWYEDGGDDEEDALLLHIGPRGGQESELHRMTTA